MIAVEIIDGECQRVEGEPFEWGKSDCVTFMVDCVKRCGGPDLIAHLPAWISEQAARQVIAGERGLYRGLVKAVRMASGRRVEHGQPGDCAYVVVNGTEAVGVIWRNGWAIARTRDGWAAVMPQHVKRIWTWQR